ncbi:MAG: glutathione S-transferase family protein [Pseudomonadota bacterium]
MPIIEPEDKTLYGLEGVHLWHANLSSCSQRVRVALAEKGECFQSHLVDLSAGENASAEYQRIHPKGLVPAIVIDGDLIIESIDIIEEIDRRFSMGSLRPQGDQRSLEMYDIMRRADKAQPHLKLLTFEFLFSAAPPPSKEASENFQKNHKNDVLKKFHREFADGFERDRIEASVNSCHDDFVQLDNVLSDGREFLAGDKFTLADIAWMPNVHRFLLFGWPLKNYRFLPRWFECVSARESYKKALLDWQPQDLVDIVAPKIIARIEAGDGVQFYGRLEGWSGNGGPAA